MQSRNYKKFLPEYSGLIELPCANNNYLKTPVTLDPLLTQFMTDGILRFGIRRGLFKIYIFEDNIRKTIDDWHGQDFMGDFAPLNAKKSEIKLIAENLISRKWQTASSLEYDQRHGSERKGNPSQDDSAYVATNQTHQTAEPVNALADPEISVYQDISSLVKIKRKQVLLVRRARLDLTTAQVKLIQAQERFYLLEKQLENTNKALETLRKDAFNYAADPDSTHDAQSPTTSHHGQIPPLNFSVARQISTLTPNSFTTPTYTPTVITPTATFTPSTFTPTAFTSTVMPNTHSMTSIPSLHQTPGSSPTTLPPDIQNSEPHELTSFLGHFNLSTQANFLKLLNKRQTNTLTNKDNQEVINCILAMQKDLSSGGLSFTSFHMDAFFRFLNLDLNTWGNIRSSLEFLLMRRANNQLVQNTVTSSSTAAPYSYPPSSSSANLPVANSFSSNNQPNLLSHPSQPLTSTHISSSTQQANTVRSSASRMASLLPIGYAKLATQASSSSTGASNSASTSSSSAPQTHQQLYYSPHAVNNVNAHPKRNEPTPLNDEHPAKKSKHNHMSNESASTQEHLAQLATSSPQVLIEELKKIDFWQAQLLALQSNQNTLTTTTSTVDHPPVAQISIQTMPTANIPQQQTVTTPLTPLSLASLRPTVNQTNATTHHQGPTHAVPDPLLPPLPAALSFPTVLQSSTFDTNNEPQQEQSLLNQSHLMGNTGFDMDSHVSQFGLFSQHSNNVLQSDHSLEDDLLTSVFNQHKQHGPQ